MQAAYNWIMIFLISESLCLTALCWLPQGSLYISLTYHSLLSANVICCFTYKTIAILYLHFVPLGLYAHVAIYFTHKYIINPDYNAIIFIKHLIFKRCLNHKKKSYIVAHVFNIFNVSFPYGPQCPHSLLMSFSPFFRNRHNGPFKAITMMQNKLHDQEIVQIQLGSL